MSSYVCLHVVSCDMRYVIRMSSYPRETYVRSRRGRGSCHRRGSAPLPPSLARDSRESGTAPNATQLGRKTASRDPSSCEYYPTCARPSSSRELERALSLAREVEVTKHPLSTHHAVLHAPQRLLRPAPCVYPPTHVSKVELLVAGY